MSELPVNDNAQPPLSHAEAIERLHEAHMDMLPTFLKCGLIRASNGWYKLGLHEDGRIALFFSFELESLEGVKLPGKEGHFPDTNKKVWVVDAKEQRTNAKWVLLSILRHQDHLTNKRIHRGMLYQTSGDTWQNAAVSYKIFPVTDEENPAPSPDEQKYTLRLYSRAQSEENFVPVDEEAPEGFFGNVFSMGENEGTYTRVEAKKIIARDFNERAQRIKYGEDPLTLRERATNARWWWRRGLERTQDYVENTPRSEKITLAMETLFTSVMTLLNPLELLTKAGEALLPRLNRLIFRDPVQQNIAESLGVKKKNWNFAEMQCIEADPEKIQEFRFLSAKEARAHYDNVPVYHDLTKDWPKEYIMGAMHGRTGGIAHPRADGVLSIQETNGLLVYNLPEHNTVFARIRPEWAQEGAPPLPRQVAELFAENEGDVLEITRKEDLGLCSRFMSKTEFRAKIADLSGNAQWDNKPSCDDFCTPQKKTGAKAKAAAPG